MNKMFVGRCFTGSNIAGGEGKGWSRTMSGCHMFLQKLFHSGLFIVRKKICMEITNLALAFFMEWMPTADIGLTD